MLSERFCSWMRQNGTKFSPRLKGWVQKIFLTLLSNFGKGLNESLLKFCPFCILYKRLLVNFKSSLLLKIIYKCTTYYNYLQTHLHLIQTNLQASKKLKTHIYRHKVIENPKLIKACIGTIFKAKSSTNLIKMWSVKTFLL